MAGINQGNGVYTYPLTGLSDVFDTTGLGNLGSLSTAVSPTSSYTMADINGVLGLEGFSPTTSMPEFSSNTNLPSSNAGNYWSGGLAALNTLSGALGAWNGLQQTKLAKDQLNFQKNAFNTQWDAQAKLTNSQLEDRQTRRVATNPNAMSVSEYMAKYGV